MAEFHSGPWKIARTNSTIFIEGSDEDIAGYICAVWGQAPDPGRFIMEANARLIAAAPAMYEALINIENDDGRIPSTIWKLRNAALALADGKEGDDV